MHDVCVSVHALHALRKNRFLAVSLRCDYASEVVELLLRYRKVLVATTHRLVARDALLGAAVGALLFATILAVPFKREIARAAFHAPRAFGPCADAINTLGGGWELVVASALLALCGVIVRSRRLIDTVLVVAAAGVWCYALTALGQFVLSEDRPIEGGAMHWFAGFGHGVSGHASAAALVPWAAREIVRTRTARTIAVALAIVWLVVVAWSRVWLGMHHAWNVLLGVAIGTWTGHAASAGLRDVDA